SGRVPVGGAPLGCRRRSERCANFHPLGHRRRSATCSRPASPAVGGVAGHALGPEVPTSDVVVAELPQPPDDHGRAGRADDALAFIDASLPVGSQPVMGGVVPAGLPGTTSPLVRLGVARAASLATGEDRGAGDRAATHLVPSGAPPACHAHLPRTQEGPDTYRVRALQGALLHRRVTRYQIWYPIRPPTWCGVSRHPPRRVEV